MVYISLENTLGSVTMTSKNEQRRDIHSINWNVLNNILPNEDATKLYNQTKCMDFKKKVECILDYDNLIWKRKCSLEILSVLGKDKSKIINLLEEGKKEFEKKYKPTIFEKIKGLISDIRYL